MHTEAQAHTRTLILTCTYTTHTQEHMCTCTYTHEHTHQETNEIAQLSHTPSNEGVLPAPWMGRSAKKKKKKSQDKGCWRMILRCGRHEELRTAIHPPMSGRGASWGWRNHRHLMICWVQPHVKQKETIHWGTHRTLLKLKDPAELASLIYLERWGGGAAL